MPTLAAGRDAAIFWGPLGLSAWTWSNPLASGDRRPSEQRLAISAIRSLTLRPDGTVVAATASSLVSPVPTAPLPEAAEVITVDSAGSMMLIRPGPRVVHLETGALAELGSNMAVRAGAFSGDGTRVAMVSRTAIEVSDVAARTLVNRFGVHSDEEGDVYTRVALSNDGRRLLTASLGGGRSALWDVASGQVLFQLGGLDVAFGPDDRWLAVGDRDKVRFVDAQTGARTGTAPVGWNSPAAVSPTGLLAVNAVGGPVVITNPSGASVSLDEPGVTALAFSNDGSELAIGTASGFVRRLPIPTPGELLTAVRAVCPRTPTIEERHRWGLPDVPGSAP